MSIRVQYNPSTGKAAYTSGTEKVQVIDVIIPIACTDCIDEPDEINVDISGVTLCCATEPGPGNSTSTTIKQAFLDSEVNKSHVLTKHATLPCRYVVEYTELDYDYSYWYSDTDCPDDPAPSGVSTIDKLQIVVYRAGYAGVEFYRVLLYLSFDPGGYDAYPFHAWGGVTGDHSEPFHEPCWEVTLSVAENTDCDITDVNHGSYTPLTIDGECVISI